jgi:hypothetical protein
MELTIPLQYEPNLKPVVVITPTGFALNYKNLKLLYPPFAERQYITEILMSALKRGYLDDKCTTPEQIHYKLRSEAFHVYEQFSKMPGGGVTTLPEKLARATITEPVLVYQELEYAGPNGKETILSPVVWFPKSYDNPYARNGMGLMYGNQIYILGDLEKGSTLYINACIQATKTLAAACRDEFTMSGIVQGENTTLASFEKNVEIASRVTRIQRYNGYDDVIFRARAEARDTLAIAARKKDVIFQGAETRSGVRTDVQAGRAILDVPLALTHHSIQYVHDDDCYGIITDTHIEQCVSKHSSGDGVATGAITMEAGDSARLYAPEFDSHTAEIASATGRSEVLDVTESHQYEAHLTEESSSWFGSDKKIHSVSVSETSKGAQFRVKRLTLAGKTGVKVKHIHSSADVTRFKAPTATVSIEQGEDRSQSFYSSHSSNALWQKASSSQDHHVTYSPSTFVGTVEIDAAALNLELVRGKTLEFLSRLAANGARVTHTVVEEVHQHEAHSSQGPSVGLSALLGVGIGILTQGTGVSALSKLGVELQSAITSTMINAGFTAVCVQASNAILVNEGDPFKAIETLIEGPAIKSVAKAMLEAGLMVKISDKLGLPAKYEPKSLEQHLKYNLAYAGVHASLAMSIDRQKAGQAILSGLQIAAVATVAGIASQKIGEMYRDEASPISFEVHKVLHTLVGAGSGAILGGEKGAVAGAIGAGLSELMAEFIKPDEELTEKITAKERELDRELTLQEHSSLRTAVLERNAGIAKLSAGIVSLLTRQDVGISLETATTALENNLLVSSLSTAANHQAYIEYLKSRGTEVEAVSVASHDAVDVEEEDGSLALTPMRKKFTTTPDYTRINLGELPPVYLTQGGVTRRGRISSSLARTSKVPSDAELLRAFTADMPASTREKALANERTREILLRQAKGVYILTHGTEKQRQQLIASMNKSSSGHAITTWKGAITKYASKQVPGSSSHQATPKLKQPAPQPTQQLPQEYTPLQWASLAKRAFMGDHSPEVLAWQQHNRTGAPHTAAFFDGASETRRRINKPIAQFKENLSKPIEISKQQNARKLEALDLSGTERVGLHAANIGLTAASIGIDLFVPGSMDQIGVDLLATATGFKVAQTAHRIAEARKIGKSLGANPFKGKTFGKIDARLRRKGFDTVGKNPAEGVGSYFHPESGRKYYLDKAGKIYKKTGLERPHVDVHRKSLETGKNLKDIKELPSDSKLTTIKRKYPLGEKLNDPTVKPIKP